MSYLIIAFNNSVFCLYFEQVIIFAVPCIIHCIGMEESLELNVNYKVKKAPRKEESSVSFIFFRLRNRRIPASTSTRESVSFDCAYLSRISSRVSLKL
jgi:hypothetical protein